MAKNIGGSPFSIFFNIEKSKKKGNIDLKIDITANDRNFACIVELTEEGAEKMADLLASVSRNILSKTNVKKIIGKKDTEKEVGEMLKKRFDVALKNAKKNGRKEIIFDDVKAAWGG